jgi:hypothetical protein
MPAYSCDDLGSTSKDPSVKLGLLTVRAAQFVSATGSPRNVTAELRRKRPHAMAGGRTDALWRRSSTLRFGKLGLPSTGERVAAGAGGLTFLLT